MGKNKRPPCTAVVKERICAFVVTAALVCMLLAGMLTGCASSKDVRQVVEVHDTLRLTKHDTLTQVKVEKEKEYVIDSLCVIERNDTVYCDRWRLVYKDRIKVDSTYKAVADSLQKEIAKKEVSEKVVEKKVYPVGYWVLIAAVIAFLTYKAKKWYDAN